MRKLTALAVALSVAGFSLAPAYPAKSGGVYVVPNFKVPRYRLVPNFKPPKDRTGENMKTPLGGAETKLENNSGNKESGR